MLEIQNADDRLLDLVHDFGDCPRLHTIKLNLKPSFLNDDIFLSLDPVEHTNTQKLRLSSLTDLTLSNSLGWKWLPFPSSPNLKRLYLTLNLTSNSDDWKHLAQFLKSCPVLSVLAITFLEQTIFPKMTDQVTMSSLVDVQLTGTLSLMFQFFWTSKVLGLRRLSMTIPGDEDDPDLDEIVPFHDDNDRFLTPSLETLKFSSIPRGGSQILGCFVGYRHLTFEASIEDAKTVTRYAVSPIRTLKVTCKYSLARLLKQLSVLIDLNETQNLVIRYWSHNYMPHDYVIDGDWQIQAPSLRSLIIYGRGGLSDSAYTLIKHHLSAPMLKEIVFYDSRRGIKSDLEITAMAG